MLELFIILLVVIAVVLISYKIGRKKKKVEMDIVAYLVLGGITTSVMLYAMLKVEFGNIFQESCDTNTVLGYE